jgi:hypothetical protein
MLVHLSSRRVLLASLARSRACRGDAGAAAAAGGTVVRARIVAQAVASFCSFGDGGGNNGLQDQFMRKLKTEFAGESMCVGWLVG